MSGYGGDTTSYAGNGGFLAASQDGHGTSPGQARNNRDKQSITPLTIKQALTAQHTNTDDKPKVNGPKDPADPRCTATALTMCNFDLDELRFISLSKMTSFSAEF